MLGLGGVRLREIPFRARLRGGQQANLQVRLPVDPQTEPGLYDFEITVGPRTFSATACVTEVVKMRLEPRAITIIASPKKSSYTKTVVFQNNGNVPLPLGNHCAVPIFESDLLLSTVLNGLSKGDRKSAQSMATAALSALADLKVGTLVIKRKAVSLSPGKKITADLRFEIPDGLEPQRRYSVSVGLYSATLKIDIYTTAKPEAAAGRSN